MKMKNPKILHFQSKNRHKIYDINPIKNLHISSNNTKFESNLKSSNLCDMFYKIKEEAITRTLWEYIR